MIPRARHPRLPIFAALALLLAAIVGLQLDFPEPSLLYLAPALALLIPLAFGRYPGERLLVAVVERYRSRPRRAAAPRSFPSVPRRPLPRGGALLAAALAGRAPPRPARFPKPEKTAERKERTMRRIAIPFAFACSLLAPAAALAHVSLHPNEVPAEAFATLDIRVPNESDSANTVKLAVQVPKGFTDVSPEYLPGWEVEVKKEKLAKPVQTDDGPITEAVREIVWTGHGEQGRIPPEQFLNFPISTQIPGKAGQTLTFKVLQFYDDGEVARWIGSPQSEDPAPSIDVTAPGGVIQDVAGSEAEPPAAAEATGASAGEPASSESSDGASKGLAIAALVVGALGLLAGGAALVQARRTRRGGPTA